MKSRFVKSLAVLLTLCMVMVSLTGCESLDYREAVQLYNSRRYEKAAELFGKLGDYEDSAALFKLSQYWSAVDLMEAGNYQDALPRFLKLKGFEDVDLRITECKYQVAIKAFTDANYTDAELLFLELGDYRQTQEYLHQLNWQKLYDYILEVGEPDGTGYTVRRDLINGVFSVAADPADPLVLRLGITVTKDMGYVFSDDLTLTLPRSAEASSFVAHSAFVMDFNGSQIGTQQTCTGTVDLSSYVPGTALTADSFEMTGTDNLGNPIHSQDPADSRMNDAMVQNLAAILEALPTLLSEAGAEYSVNN